MRHLIISDIWTSTIKISSVNLTIRRGRNKRLQEHLCSTKNTLIIWLSLYFVLYYLERWPEYKLHSIFMLNLVWFRVGLRNTDGVVMGVVCIWETTINLTEKKKYVF